MRTLLFALLISFSFSACVDSDSSVSAGGAYHPTDGDMNSTDSNDSNDSNSTEQEDLGDPNADQIGSDFDTRDAIKDQNACVINTTFKNGMDDSSFNPEETKDDENGISISSFLTYDADDKKTMVTVYYPDLGTQPSDSWNTITKESYYRVGFDKEWPTSGNNIIYVQTPKGIGSNYYGCMRYTLSLVKSSVVAQRVYRIRE